MNLDPKARALAADVDAIRDRIKQQLAADPDNEVALAMYRADLRRAKEALTLHGAEGQSREPPVRRYVDGRLVA